MTVDFLSKSVNGIYNSDQTKWDVKLKSLSDRELTSSLDAIISHADKTQCKVWELSSKILSELQARPYAKGHQNTLHSLQEKVANKSKGCLVDAAYCLETSGVTEKSLTRHGSSKKVLHPFAQTSTAKKVVAKWKNSSTKTSLDTYIKKYMPTRYKRDLKKKTVTYLSPAEQKKFRVSFHNKKVLIGGQKPKDGKYIFALSNDGEKLLAGKKKKGEFQHSSFFAGANVKTPGIAKIKDRKLKKAELISGHYKPEKKHGENLRKFLKDEDRLGKKAKSLPIRAHR